MDLFIAQGSTLERVRDGRNPHGVLLRNLGNWSFEDVTEKAGLTRGAWGMGVNAADVDNDGLVDIYLTNLGPNVLYHNNGDGTFTDISGAGRCRRSTLEHHGRVRRLRRRRAARHLRGQLPRGRAGEAAGGESALPVPWHPVHVRPA